MATTFNHSDFNAAFANDLRTMRDNILTMICLGSIAAVLLLVVYPLDSAVPVFTKITTSLMPPLVLMIILFLEWASFAFINRLWSHRIAAAAMQLMQGAILAVGIFALCMGLVLLGMEILTDIVTGLVTGDWTGWHEHNQEIVRTAIIFLASMVCAIGFLILMTVFASLPMYRQLYEGRRL